MMILIILIGPCLMSNGANSASYTCRAQKTALPPNPKPTLRKGNAAFL